jgi:manganese transport protein
VAKSIWQRTAVRLGVRNGEADDQTVAGVEGVLPGESATARAAHASLKGDKRGLARLWPFLGPAFIAAVAYVDPGNFATNISGGAQFGYLLLWVILTSNLMAMLIQSMSAKLGIATGKNLPEVCRERFPRLVTLGLWVQAEVIAMATDLAEFIGAALALNLLFGIPLFPAGLMTAVGAFAILELQRRGFRPLEAAIAALVGVIVVAFAFQMFYAQPEADRILAGLFTPQFAGTESVLLAAGILGATVMPHVIYLHSALTQRRVVGRTDEEKKKIFRFELVDVVIAMAIAGTINASMLIMAAALFHANGLTGVGDIDLAFEQLGVQVGSTSAILFGVALLASGFSSSSVGTMAGQVVMQDRQALP